MATIGINNMKVRYPIVIRQVQGRRIKLSKNTFQIGGLMLVCTAGDTAINLSVVI
jgi:hypothetical protein